METTGVGLVSTQQHVSFHDSVREHNLLKRTRQQNPQVFELLAVLLLRPLPWVRESGVRCTFFGAFRCC